MRRVQSLWGGYGEVVRYALTGHEADSVVVKHVQAPPGRGRSHERKLRSYAIEQTFYARFAHRAGSRVARRWHAEPGLLILEDLDETRKPSLGECLCWLAAFHASFLGVEPDGLWPEGSYWHLATRPDELRAMAPGPLREAAPALDARLAGARFRTLVHGDAKPANFLRARDGTPAAVDFQYVGGGVGMRDVAYLLYGESDRDTRAGLDLYFRALHEALGGADAVEREWRELFPVAVADFQRFLAGWCR